MDNAKKKVGKNLTYMLVSSSIPIRMDRYDENNLKEKCFQDAAYKANNTHPEVNISDIDRNFRK
jgi:hypothetical protein